MSRNKKSAPKAWFGLNCAVRAAIIVAIIATGCEILPRRITPKVTKINIHVGYSLDGAMANEKNIKVF